MSAANDEIASQAPEADDAESYVYDDEEEGSSGDEEESGSEEESSGDEDDEGDDEDSSGDEEESDDDGDGDDGDGDRQSDASSQLSDDEGYDYLDPYDEASLPPYSCRYCGIHDPASVAKCVESGKWLCNAPCSFGGGSHLVNHLVRSRSNQVQLHPESPLGDTVLECYNCASKNAFVLGFVPASSSSVVVLLCRVCVETVPALKDMDWELSQWHPLVQDRKFLPWLVKVSFTLEFLAS